MYILTYKLENSNMNCSPNNQTKPDPRYLDLCLVQSNLQLCAKNTDFNTLMNHLIRTCEKYKNAFKYFA